VEISVRDHGEGMRGVEICGRGVREGESEDSEDEREELHFEAQDPQSSAMSLVALIRSFEWGTKLMRLP